MDKPPKLDPRTLFPRACTTCGTPKARDDFGQRKVRGAWLIQRRCQACVTAKAMDWHKDNVDAHAAANARWLEKNREREYTLKQERYQADPEQHRARARAYHAENRDERNAAYARWSAENPDKERERRARYHAENRDRRNEYGEAYRQHLAAETRPVAHHHRHEWTGTELEIADRRDLTAREAALLLGRTAAAVSVMRYKIDKRDPRTLSKLGYDPNKEIG